MKLVAISVIQNTKEKKNGITFLIAISNQRDSYVQLPPPCQCLNYKVTKPRASINLQFTLCTRLNPAANVLIYQYTCAIIALCNRAINHKYASTPDRLIKIMDTEHCIQHEMISLNSPGATDNSESSWAVDRGS